MAFRANEIYEELLAAAAAAKTASGGGCLAPGAAAWLGGLQDYNMPVAVVTKMGRKQAQRLLESMGLARYFRQVASTLSLPPPSRLRATSKAC